MGVMVAIIRRLGKYFGGVDSMVERCSGRKLLDSLYIYEYHSKEINNIRSLKMKKLTES